MTGPVELADGARVMPVPGFRDAVLRARPSGTPNERWSADDYARCARRRVVEARRRAGALAAAVGGGRLARALEIGCGGGLDCVLAALDGIEQVVGIDVDSPLLDADRRAPALRLIGAAGALVGCDQDGEALLERLPVEVQAMDVRALDYPDASFDVVFSRVVLEHVKPLSAVLAETARVLRPGGVAHHVIDPFFWLKGCHSRGLTELPWAHARLTLDDYQRFVAAAESRGRAARRTAWLRSLNALGIDGWRAVFEADSAFELVDYGERHSDVAAELLARHPEVLDDTLPGVDVRDLTCSAITVVLRRAQDGPAA